MKNLPFLLFLFLFSCGKVKQIDTSDIREEMRNNKVKRVTEKQLLRKVSEIGESLSSKFNSDFNVECMNEYRMDGHTVAFYNTKLLTDTQLAEGRKGQVLEAYKYGIENGQPVSSNIQTLTDTLYAYSFPLKQGSYMKTVCGSDFGLVIISKTQLVKQL